MKTFGIVFADTMEYGPFLEKARQLGGKESIRRSRDSVELVYEVSGKAVRLIGVKSGIGKVNAASATSFLISDDRVDYILNAGLSGAIQGLRREDMVAVESYVECDYDLTAIGKPLGVKADNEKYIYSADEALLSLALMSEGVLRARAGTGDVFLTDSARKQLYKNTFSITCFDMETAAIAGVCDKCGIPMLSLRKISDDAEGDAYEAYTEMNNRQESCLTELLFNILDRYISTL